MSRCARLSSIILWSCALCSLESAPVRADGLIRDGVGAVSTGRGGTNLGFSDNGVILLDNPAGMVNVGGRGLAEFGVDTLITDLDYSDPENSINGEFAPCYAPQGSYIRRSEDGRWAVGIGYFMPAGFTAEYEMVNPIFGEQDYRSMGLLAKILPGVAYRVSDRLSVGATLGVAIGHAELEGPYFVQTAPLAGTPTLMDLSVTGAAPTWSLGLQYDLGPNTVLGIAYTSETRFRLKGDAEIFVPGPFPLAGEFDARMDKVWPQSVGIGIMHVHNCRHRVSADVIWYDWSGAFDQFDLKLTDATNPAFAFVAGPTIRDTVPLDWDDSISVRLGYEFLQNCCNTWRVGYVYHPSPVPDATLIPYIDGVLEHAVSVGWSRRFWQNWSFNSGYQFSFSPERHVGNSALVGGDFSNSEFKAQAHWLMFSVIRQF